MGLFGSSGKKYKRAAERALRTAEDIQDYQSEVEFRRNLISNIRQERIARAMLEVGNYSTTASSSSAAGALANIDSSLAGETYFSYASSDRAQRVQDLNEYAQKMYQKYQKKQKKRAAIGSIAGTVVGTVAGGLLGGPIGAAVGGSIGQGLGQIASGTGSTQTMQGIQNIITGGTQWYMAANMPELNKTTYAASSFNTTTGQLYNTQYYRGATPITFLGGSY